MAEQPRDARHLRRPRPHIHLKDVVRRGPAQAQAESWSFGQALKSFIFPALAEGIAQAPECVAALLGRDDDGWFVLEQDTTPDDPKYVARANREYLEVLLGGLTTGLMGEAMPPCIPPTRGPHADLEGRARPVAARHAARSPAVAPATSAARCRRWTCWSRSTSESSDPGGRAELGRPRPVHPVQGPLGGRPLRGHGQRGFFPIEELATFDTGDFRLQGHPDMTRLPGLDASTGSLGQGLAVGVGIALGARLRGRGFARS